MKRDVLPKNGKSKHHRMLSEFDFREKLERERRDAEYKRPSRYDSGPPARDQWNQPPPSMSAMPSMPSRHGGHPPSRDAPAGLWPGNQQT